MFYPLGAPATAGWGTSMAYRRLLRPCVKCGRDAPMIPHQRFCSRACAGLQPEEPRPCARCGVTFKPSRRDVRYCSTTCASAARRRRLPQPCPLCSRVFTPTFTGQKFCTRACAMTGRSRPTRPCETCSSVFTARSGGQRFCSPRCAGRWRRRHRIRPSPAFTGLCEFCRVTFPAKDRRHRFCSRKCFDAARKQRNRRHCAYCGVDFGFTDSRQRFCSKRCGVLGQRKNTAERAHNWNGGRSAKGTHGYVRVRAPQHPRATKHMPYVLEHILVMEKTIGRYLEPNERVHHRNGRRDDNRPENLELWKVKDPPGVRAADYHCAGCTCDRVGVQSESAGAQLAEQPTPWTPAAAA